MHIDTYIFRSICVLVYYTAIFGGGKRFGDDCRSVCLTLLRISTNSDREVYDDNIVVMIWYNICYLFRITGGNRRATALSTVERQQTTL